MKEIISFLFIVAVLYVTGARAEVYLSRNGKITFFSQAHLENIEAVNNEATSLLDSKKGEFVFAVLIKSFRFKKALMEEHIDENYMESNTFPKADFKGNISDLSKINFSKDGIYPVTVDGDLIIHGITKKVLIPGSIIIKGGVITASSKFTVKVKDYDIKIPSIVENKIAETIEVSVDCKYDPSQKS